MKQPEMVVSDMNYRTRAGADGCQAPPWDEDVGGHPYVDRTVKAVSGVLYNRIASGSYPFGTRLPAERKLSTEFKQSRNTIRNAILFLENYGVVTRRGNAGTFVSANVLNVADLTALELTSLVDAKKIAEKISPIDMYVAQSGIEPEIARLATVSMSIRDLVNLKSVLSEIYSAVDDLDRFFELEQLFLMTLCAGTKNTALVGMYAILNEFRSLPEGRESRKHVLTPVKVRELVRIFQALVHAFERRQANRAEECMRLYIAASQGGILRGVDAKFGVLAPGV